MAFSGSQTTALQPYGAPGRTRSFVSKTAAAAAPTIVLLLTLQGNSADLGAVSGNTADLDSIDGATANLRNVKGKS